MTWSLAVNLITNVLLLAGAAGWVIYQVRADRLAINRRVLANLIDGSAMDGVLIARRRGYLVLKNVTRLDPGSEPTPVDGEVLVDKDRVDFLQVLGPG